MSGGKPVATRLEDALVPIVKGLGLELYQVTYGRERGGVVSVYIDHPDGITLEECERTSRAIGDSGVVDDIVDGSYALEVSSPGLERPLIRPEHYRRFLGKNILVKTKRPLGGRRKFSGKLVAVRENDFDIECDGSTVAVAYEDVTRARLVFEPE